MQPDPVSFEQFLGWIVFLFKANLIWIGIVFGLVFLAGITGFVFVMRRRKRIKAQFGGMFGDMLDDI